MTEDERGSDQLSQRVIGCAFAVVNALGCGFLEKVYENALAHEMRKAGLKVVQQQKVTVLYDNVIVGDYIVDLLIEDTLLVEIKCVKNVEEVHRAQCINYLKATGRTVCLLINFGKPRLEIRRVSFGL